jgi:hypothetical protein
MLVYTSHITNRLQNIIDYFNEKLNLQAVLTTDEKFYNANEAEKINYSENRISAKEIFIQPCGLLKETGIKRQYIECFEWNGVAAFFKTDDDLGFDIFSAVFYLLSRYEEYKEHEPDEYGRYAHWNSLAWKEGFIHKPLVDIWLANFKNIILNKFTNFKFQISNFKFVPSYDIDIAWSYLNKGFWRSIGASVSKPSTIAQRLNVITKKEKDPFDCYDWLQQLHAANELQPIFFFLVAEERGQLDKNISPRKKALQQLIVNTQTKVAVGLHPSVHSNTAKECLIKEKQRLEQITRSTITKSRHHYLQFHLPHSYRELIAAGITDDYSMGYGTVNGFRASTSNSFLWYDLEKEETTSLRIHPFAFMEANSFYELHHSPAEALAELKQLYTQIKNVNGTLITIFHNHFLGSDAMFSGWKEMYEQFVSDVNIAQEVN